LAIRRQTARHKLNISRYIVVFFLLFLVVSTGLLGVVVFSAWHDLPSWEMGALQPGTPSVICDAYGEPFAQLGLENYLPVEYAEVPLPLREAILSVEDARFYQHHGVDMRAILRALWANFTRKKLVQGGSTLTQQVAKNAFLTPERTLKRKIQEALLAVQLERYYSKNEIFLAYLNCIYFGEGARGIGAAAKTYFNKKITDLTLAEAALLAGLPQAPSYYSPYRNYEAALKRRNSVLDLMVKRVFITSQQGRQAKQEPINLNKKGPDKRLLAYPYPYFVDCVIQQMNQKYDEGYLYRGGLKIHTTLDQEAQQAAEQAVSRTANFPGSTRDEQGTLQPQVAIVLLDSKSGDIKALVGGREHTASLVYNRATMAYLQPGSAFKPVIAYAPALEYLNMTPESTVKDAPVRFKGYQPHNYDGRYRGTVTLTQALAYSLNVPAIKILNQVGLEQAVAFARQLGFTSLDPEKEGLSAALGGLYRGVTPLQMAAAYVAFANGGTYFTPRVITRVALADGTELERTDPASHKVMNWRTAQMITRMLQAVVNYGTGRRAQIPGLMVAGKTGTTDQGKDTWFCGYTTDLVGVVWMGWDLPRSMPEASGGLYCAQLWRQIMLEAINFIPKTPRPHKPVAPDSEQKQTVSEESGKRENLISPDEKTNQVLESEPLSTPEFPEPEQPNNTGNFP
jgi:penicillin-binding protein 1A